MKWMLCVLINLSKIQEDGARSVSRETLRGLRPTEASGALDAAGAIAVVEVAVGSNCCDFAYALATAVPVCCGIPVAQACAGHWYGGFHQHCVWWGVQDQMRAERKTMRAVVAAEWGVRDETGGAVEAFCGVAPDCSQCSVGGIVFALLFCFLLVCLRTWNS